MSTLAGAGGPAGESVGSGGDRAADCRLRHDNQPDLLFRVANRTQKKKKTKGFNRQWHETDFA